LKSIIGGLLFYQEEVAAVPLSKGLLDYIVHEGGEAPNTSNKYNRDELSALIRIQPKLSSLLNIT
jgi:hypothetical protein